MRSREPEGQIGVFKRYSQIPPRYRLNQHESAFDDRDVWAEFLAAEDRREHVRTNDQAALRRVETEWKGHMAERGRHHALATPADVNE